MNNIYEETKFLMKKYNITANKNLGQNFLIDDETVEKIVVLLTVGLSNICHTLLINIAVEIPFMIHKLYNAVNSKYFSFGLFQFNGFIGKLLYSLDQCLSFSLKSSKLTNILL